MDKIIRITEEYYQNHPNVIVIVRKKSLAVVGSKKSGTRIIDLKKSLDPKDNWIKKVFNKKRKKNVIMIGMDNEYISALSQVGHKIPPLLDDFCQIIGLSVKCLPEFEIKEITSALTFNNACIIKNRGAILVGRTLYETDTALKVLEKSAKSYIEATLIGKVRPVSKIKAFIMMIVYSLRYSKAEQTRKLKEMQSD